VGSSDSGVGLNSGGVNTGIVPPVFTGIGPPVPDAFKWTS